VKRPTTSVRSQIVNGAPASSENYCSVLTIDLRECYFSQIIRLEFAVHLEILIQKGSSGLNGTVAVHSVMQACTCLCTGSSRRNRILVREDCS
jgi:hypothetical protein